MAKLIIAISNHLPDSQNRLNNFICSFTLTMALLQLSSALVLCNIFKNAGKLTSICLYSLIIMLFVIGLTIIFNKAIEYLSNSKNALNVLKDKEQINYDKQLLILDRIKWTSVWIFICIVVIVTTFDYTITIPILLVIIFSFALVTIIMRIDN